MNLPMKLALAVLLSILFVNPGYAQQQVAHADKKYGLVDCPKLVVGIVVDQMRYEYIPRFWAKYGDDGFKRLVKEGYSFSNMHYNYFPTYTGPGHAAIYTGTTPSINGIVGNSWYNRKLGRNEYVVEDTLVTTVGGKADLGHRSPANLLSTTFTDELKTMSKASKIVGVSIKDRGAILPAGHLADLALWYDDSRGNFISSSWYVNDLPDWVKEFNMQGTARKYSKKTWNLLLSADQYAQSNTDDSPYEAAFPWEEKPVFPHQLGKAEGDTYWTIKGSPFGNTLVKDLAKQALINEQLGEDSVTDVLTVSFSSTDYVGHQFGPYSMELEDTYIRLDRDLADLFSELDSRVGKGNYLVFLTADHGVVDVPQELKDRGLPGGYFKSKAAIDSLKIFLNNNYGNAEWVEAYANQQVYLNRDLIAEEEIWLEDMQDDVSNFLLQFEGVLSTNTASNFKIYDYTGGLQAMYQRGFLYKRSGDVYIQLKPGWLDSSYLTGTSHGSPYSYDTHVPLIFYGWNIPQGTSSRKSVIPQIAPTISNMLQIEFPNGSAGNLLIFD